MKVPVPVRAPQYLATVILWLQTGLAVLFWTALAAAGAVGVMEGLAKVPGHREKMA